MLVWDWDHLNTRHLSRHGISPRDCEEVIFNRPIDVSSEVRNGEERITQIGETNDLRVLIVVSTTLPNGRIRIVTAWPAKERLRRYFLTHKRTGNAGRAEE